MGGVTLPDELANLRAIVTDLATGPAPIASTEMGHDPYCVLCGKEAWTNDEVRALYNDQTRAHEPDCLWIRAKAAVFE